MEHLIEIRYGQGYDKDQTYQIQKLEESYAELHHTDLPFNLSSPEA
jgi:hypothetical protein